VQESIISGLISGVTVAFLILLIRGFWNAVIVPWFEERVYKDVKIEGKWFGLYPTTTDLRQDVITLHRHGHAVTGKMICTKGGDEGEEYCITGSFRNMLLPLTYETTDNQKTDRGSITLICVRNGERLKGKIAFYHTLEDSIATGNILWFRSKDDLNRTVTQIESRKEEIEKIKKERIRLSKEEEEIETLDDEEVIGGVLADVDEESANKSSNADAEGADS
jgi:hypothetical protein